ncbi:hypothetical protein J4459_03885 [Candidatus Woesearchaeota archaeon]|nr:hypothetical protein [Candidatus Woesearchaeota archaeon]
MKERLLKDLNKFSMIFAVVYFILIILFTIIWTNKNSLANLQLSIILSSIIILAMVTVPFFTYFQSEKFSWIDLILNISFIITGLMILILFLITIL